MFCIGLSYTIKFWSFMKRVQNNTSLFHFRNPWFYTLKIFPLSHNCSVRQPPVSIYQLPLPSLVTLLELLMQNAQLILELSYDVHSGSSKQTKSALIIKISEDIFNVFFFVILIMSWSQLNLIVLAELQTAWNISLGMSSCLCIAGNMNILVCFLWFSHLPD